MLQPYILKKIMSSYGFMAIPWAIYYNYNHKNLRIQHGKFLIIRGFGNAFIVCVGLNIIGN